MKTKLKNVYYCDYCKKHGLHSYHMKEHEKTCNLNPHRSCKSCDMEPSRFNGLVKKYSDAYDIAYPCGKKESAAEFKEKDMYAYPEIHDASTIWKKEVSINEIESDCDECPVCVLSVLKITGLINMPGMIFDYEEKYKNWVDANYNYN